MKLRIYLNQFQCIRYSATELPIYATCNVTQVVHSAAYPLRLISEHCQENYASAKKDNCFFSVSFAFLFCSAHIVATALPLGL